MKISTEWAISSAKRICRRKGRMTSDDLRKHAVSQGLNDVTPNTWGSLFAAMHKMGIIKPVDRKRSGISSNHGRTVIEWELI